MQSDLRLDLDMGIWKCGSRQRGKCGVRRKKGPPTAEAEVKGGIRKQKGKAPREKASSTQKKLADAQSRKAEEQSGGAKRRR
jgi:hypothetical protein